MRSVARGEMGERGTWVGGVRSWEGRVRRGGCGGEGGWLTRSMLGRA